MWKVVDLIIEETEEVNKEKGTSFNIIESVVSQIYFFACPNMFMDIKIYSDVEKYLYCEKFNVPPYKGSYEEQPAKWVKRAFAIKNAFAKKEKKEIENVRKNSNKV